MRRKSEEDLLLSSTQEKKGTKRKRSIIDVEIRIKIYWPEIPSEKSTKEQSVRKRAYQLRKHPRINFDDEEYFFKNLEDRWLIVQLNEHVMLESCHHQLENYITQVFGDDTPYYIPVYWEKVQDKEISYILCEGYIFIVQSKKVLDSIHKLRSEYIQGPIRAKNKYQTIPTVSINKFKEDVRNKVYAMVPERGAKVKPKVGTFKNMVGKVVSVDRKNLTAMVRFNKSSRVVEAPLYVLNLDKAENEDL